MPTKVWKFVDSISATPVTNFDMNRPDGKVALNFGKTFDISPPSKRRSFTTNSMVDGGLLTADSYENRVLEFTVTLQGTLAQKVALHKQLKKQLGKDKNLIMYTPKAGVVDPVFFRTMSSDDYELVEKTTEGFWHITCKVIADPFAIGLRVDHTIGAVITNNPASGANPARLDLTNIIGDVPTPPLIKITSSVTAGLKNNPIWIGQRTRDPASFFDNWKQAESMTLGTDATTWTAGSNASGGTPNMVAVSFNTSTALSGRLTGSFPPTAGNKEALRGRYRVFVRAGTGNDGSTFKMRWAIPQGNTWIRGLTRSYILSSDTTKRRILDLGVIAHPPYEVPSEIGYGSLPPGAEDIWMTLDVEVVSGDNLDLDYVYLMPADERLCVVSGATTDGGNGIPILIIDGPNDMTYGGSSGMSLFDTNVANRGVFNSYGLVPRVGGLPILKPGVTNRWYILQESAQITDTLTFDVHYWPKWLEVATP